MTNKDDIPEPDPSPLFSLLDRLFSRPIQLHRHNTTLYKSIDLRVEVDPTVPDNEIQIRTPGKTYTISLANTEGTDTE